MRTMTLSSKLVLAGITLILIPMTFVSFFSISTATGSLESAARNKFVAVAKSLAEMTHVSLSEELKMIKGLATRPNIVELATQVAENGSADSAGRLNLEVKDVWKQVGSDYETIIITGLDGMVYANAVHEISRRISIADREYFKTAIKGTLNIGTVLKSKGTGNPVVPICTPIYSETGEVVGTLTFVLKTDFFAHLISDTKLGETGYAMLADQAGVVIAHPVKDFILNQDIENFEGMSKIAREALGGKTGSATYVHGGVDKVGGYAPVELTGWTVIASGDADEQFARIYALKKTLVLFGSLFFSAAIILVFFLARRISKPIRHLATAARRFGKGELGTRTGLRHTADELGQLAKSFDDMALLLEIRNNESKQAEKALRESEQKYRALIETTDTGYAVVDPEGRLLDGNAEYARLCGHETVEEIIGKSILDWTQPYDVQKNIDAVGKCVTTGFIKDLEVDHVDKDGRVLPVEINASLIQTAEGPVVLALCRDITERKRTESALQKSYDELEDKVTERTAALAAANDQLRSEIEVRKKTEGSLRDNEIKYRNLYQEFHALLDAIPDILVLLTPDLKAVWANRAYAAKAGKIEELSSLVGQHCFQQLHERKEPCPNCPAPKSFESGKPATSVITTAEGEVFEVRAVPIQDENGKVIKLINVARDITEARKAEEELQRTFTEMAQLLASIPSFLIGVTPENKIMRWNRAAEKTFGMPAVRVMGMSFFDCGIPWDWRKISEAVASCRENSRATKLDDFRFPRPDGKEGFLNVMISRIEGTGNGSAGILLLGNDITKRKVLESQLVQAQKLESIGQLAAGIAHEINTPAQYVGDNARFLTEVHDDLERVYALYEQLLNEIKSGNPTQDIVRKIEAALEEVDFEYIRREAPKAARQSIEGIDRISGIVRAMKEFSHPGTNEKTNADLNKSIESTITVARNEWKYVAEMVTDFDPGLPPVPCLPGEINQVILNMIINATHSIGDVLKQNGSDRKGTITISTRARAKYAEIRVSDTGAGIPDSISSKVFDPFFTTKEVGKGTGQGLAICRSVVVDKHGGTVSFESEVGKGTTFIINLPLPNRSGKL